MCFLCTVIPVSSALRLYNSCDSSLREESPIKKGRPSIGTPFTHARVYRRASSILNFIRFFPYPIFAYTDLICV